MSDFFAHESSYVDEGVTIGKNTKIWHFSHIMTGTEIGENCSFGQNCVVGPRAKVGNGVKVQNNISIYEGVEVEDDAFLGPSMVFTNVINPRSFIVRKEEYRKTLVKKGASIGANVTVVCGTTIGRYAFIGAGSVVVSDIPPNVMAAGNPAKVIKELDPGRDIITRKDRYADAGQTLHILESSERQTLKGNTLSGWIKSLFFPPKDNGS